MYEIKSVRFYQSVPLNGGQVNYFTPQYYLSLRNDQNAAIKVSVVDKGIQLESPTEITLVSWNNVASVLYDKSRVVDDGKPEVKVKSGKTADFRNI